MTFSPSSPWPDYFDVADDVATALHEGRGVVALESTIVVHGLPSPDNLEVAADCEAAVRAAGAVPATIGVRDGRVLIGMSPDVLATLADPARSTSKLSSRDIGLAVAGRRDGATTVAATITLARRAGISFMATGGLGGVHRGAQVSYDESADLTTLSRTSVCVVAAGVKSILDIGATLERLDSLGVPVVGYRTDRFPGFYLPDAGYDLDWRLDSPHDIARAFAYHQTISPTGMLVAQPIDAADALDADVHARALDEGLRRAHDSGATGKAVTPIILSAFAAATSGVSVRVNRTLVVANARLAAAIATNTP